MQKSRNTIAYGKQRYFRTCPKCGASLDPGERCTCINHTGQIGTPRHALFWQHKTNHKSLGN